jgi:hypothetical protein
MSVWRVVVLATAAAWLAASAAAQDVSPLSLADLQNGGWSKSSNYSLDLKTQSKITENLTSLEKEKWAEEIEKAKKGWEYAEQWEKIGKGINEFAEAVEKYNKMMEAYEHLTPHDGPFEPNYTPPGTPEIPTHCAGNSKCTQCYEQAYGQLTAVRVRFEKLRVLYGSTMAWIRSAISFGDTAASAVGIGGLAWQTERKKVEGSVANLNTAYDNKYVELCNTLQEALKAIDGCEATEFHNPDWYNRFGYMFYTFMQAHYHR